VKGMVCDFCARGITKTFYKDDTVIKVDVDLETGKVFIAYLKSKKINFEDIKEKITKNGQTAITMKITKL
jgi:copper chaperone CopZ